MLQKIRWKLFGTNDGLTIYFTVTMFIGMTVIWYLLLRPITDWKEFAVLALITVLGSTIAGWIMGNQFDKDWKFVLPTDSKTEDSLKKYGQWLKSEYIPKTKPDKVKYSEYLDNFESLNTKSIKNPFVYIMYIYSVYVLAAGSGLHILRILALFLVFILTLCFISIKFKLAKIKRVKAKL